jgi:hypothetical protein
MRYDAAFLVGGDDQRWQASRAPFFPQRRELFFQTGRRRSHDIVPGDVDAGNQALLGKDGYLRE